MMDTDAEFVRIPRPPTFQEYRSFQSIPELSERERKHFRLQLRIALTFRMPEAKLWDEQSEEAKQAVIDDVNTSCPFLKERFDDSWPIEFCGRTLIMEQRRNVLAQRSILTGITTNAPFSLAAAKKQLPEYIGYLVPEPLEQQLGAAPSQVADEHEFPDPARQGRPTVEYTGPRNVATALAIPHDHSAWQPQPPAVQSETSLQGAAGAPPTMGNLIPCTPAAPASASTTRKSSSRATGGTSTPRARSRRPTSKSGFRSFTPTDYGVLSTTITPKDNSCFWAFMDAALFPTARLRWLARVRDRVPGKTLLARLVAALGRVGPHGLSADAARGLGLAALHAAVLRATVADTPGTLQRVRALDAGVAAHAQDGVRVADVEAFLRSVDDGLGAALEAFVRAGVQNWVALAAVGVLPDADARAFLREEVGLDEATADNVLRGLQDALLPN